MQYKQNSLKRALFAKGVIVKAAAVFLVAAILPLAGTAQVLAAGDASFSLSSSGSTTVGSTFTVTVSETSSGADNVNGVQANVSYPSGQLQYQGYSQGVFTLCGQTPSAGAVDDGCATTSPVSGTQTVMSISFKVVGSGSGVVSMASGSDIDNTSGASVWNGSLTSATYNFSAPASSGGSSGGSSSGGSTAKSSAPAASSHVSTPSSTPTTSPSKPATPTPTTTTTPQTTTQQPSTTQAATAALTITVTDSSGKPVKGAKVTVDSQYSALTDANGKASLSGLPVGNHKVSVTASGKTTTTTTLMLASNENKQVSLKLAANQSFTPIIYVVLGLLVLGGGAVALLKLRGGGSIHGPQTPVSGIVVGSGNIPATPVRPTPTVQPTTPQPVTPQVTSPQPPASPSAQTDTTPKVQ